MGEEFLVGVFEFGAELAGELLAFGAIGCCGFGGCRCDFAAECHVEAGAAGWDPGVYAVEFFCAQDDDWDDGRVGSQGDCADAFFQCAAAEDGIVAFGDAAFWEYPDDLALANEFDGAADGGEGISEAVDWERAALVERGCAPPALVEFDAGHPTDLAAHRAADDEWLEVADMGAGEEEAAGAIDALAVQGGFADALELDEIAGKAAGLVESDAHLGVGCLHG